MAQEQQQAKKVLSRFRGTVVNDAVDKTLTVEVHRYATHPKYRKKYRITKRYLVHDPENRYKKGDRVVFVPSRPYSKRKRFIVLSEEEKKTS